MDGKLEKEIPRFLLHIFCSLRSRRYLGGRARVGEARGGGGCEGERKRARIYLL